MKIIAAAIKLKTGLILSIPPPARHNNVMDALNYPDNDTDFSIRKLMLKGHVSGFLLDDGNFVDRQTATE